MRLSIATKVFLGFAAVLATSALVSAYGVRELHRIGQGLQLVSTGFVPLTRAAGSLEAFQKERQRSTERLLAEEDPAVRRGLVALDRTYFARVMSAQLQRCRELAQAASAAAEGGGDRAALERIDARLATLGQRIAEEEQLARVLTAALDRPEAQARGAVTQLEALQEPIARLQTQQRRVAHEIKVLLDVIQDQIDRGVAEAEKQERTSRWAIVALALLALGVGLLVTWLSHRALAPIRGLTEAAQRIGRGAPDAVAVPESGGDELAVLAREFNAMAQRLAARERELRAQGEALVRSERLAAIGRIAAQITHEIRNPLSSISLNVEELADRLREADGGTRAETLALCEAIVREVDRLAAVTEEYLRFARLPKPHLAHADLNDTVRDLVAFVRPELEGAGVQLEQRLAPELPRVLADVGQLRQLLLNLIRNAREAMPGGGTVEVTTQRGADGSVEVRVHDTGPGIPPERLPRIFDPFFTTKERGTGLGLALAQEIAQEHGGQLTVASAAGSTTFTLLIPPLATSRTPGSGTPGRTAVHEPAIAPS